jgi:hypothetical protein
MGGCHITFELANRLLAAAVNSLYSFWWDVTNDWGLELLKLTQDSRTQLPRRLVLPHLHSGAPLLNGHAQRSSADLNHASVPSGRYPWGLRSVLLYPLPVYPILIFLNLILRMTWSIKLSSHLHSRSEASMTIFSLEIAEIFRRWMWVYVRVEWETIRKSQEPRRLHADDLSGDDTDFEMIPTGSEHETA